jgi:hypothetical protein
MSWEEYKYYFVRCYEQQKFDQLGCCGPVLVVLAVVFILASCKTVEYVPVETVIERDIHHTDTIEKVDTVEKEKLIRITEMDSAMAAEYGIKLAMQQKAYLVLQKELERVTKMQREVAHDTINNKKKIEVPYPVERKLSKWETFYIDYGKVMVGTTATVLLLLIFLVARWLHTRKQ